MALILALGIIIGVVSVVFVMENATLATVSILSLEFTAPLALIILLSAVLGMIVTLLSMVPQAIREKLDELAARREQRRAEAAAAAQNVTVSS